MKSQPPLASFLPNDLDGPKYLFVHTPRFCGFYVRVIDPGLRCAYEYIPTSTEISTQDPLVLRMLDDPATQLWGPDPEDDRWGEPGEGDGEVVVLAVARVFSQWVTALYLAPEEHRERLAPFLARLPREDLRRLWRMFGDRRRAVEGLATALS